MKDLKSTDDEIFQEVMNNSLKIIKITAKRKSKRVNELIAKSPTFEYCLECINDQYLILEIKQIILEIVIDIIEENNVCLEV